jgi:hypothetical protein
MAVGGEDERKKYFRDGKMNLREVNMKYGRLFVFIRNDSAEIWGINYELKLGIGTLKVIASTGVFVRVICDLKLSISSDTRTSSKAAATRKTKKVNIFTNGGNAQKKQNADRE